MDEIKIKALIDAADSAKTIQELKKALRDLKSAAVEVGEGSESFNRITQAAGQVSDQIGDLNAQVKNLGDDLFKLRGVAQIGQGIAAGFAVAQGAIAMFGAENGALEQSLLKVNAAMSMLNGVMAIGELLQKESAAVLLTQNIVRGATVGLVGKETVAKAQLAVANGTATLTQRALNAAMTANPAGILIAAITALVGVYYLFSSSTDELKAKNDALNSSLEYSRKLLDAQEDAVIKEIDNRKKLAESRGADAKEISKLELEKLNEQEKYAKKRKTALENELKAERKQRTDLIFQGEDDLAKETNTKIEKKQEELDKIDNMLQKTVGYENQYALEREVIQNKLTQSEKKENDKRLKDNKKTTDSKLDNAKKFAVDMNKVNAVIYDNEIKMQEALLSTWGDTYDKKVLEQLSAEAKANKEVSDAQKELLNSLQEDYLKSEDFLKLKIEVTGIEDTRFQSAWNNFLKSNNIEAQKAQIALNLIQKSGEEARTAISAQYAETRKELAEQERKRIRELFEESTKIVLAQDEYKRFYEFLNIQIDKFSTNIKEQGKALDGFDAKNKQSAQERIDAIKAEIAAEELKIQKNKEVDEKNNEINRTLMEQGSITRDNYEDTLKLNEKAIDDIKAVIATKNEQITAINGETDAQLQYNKAFKQWSDNLGQTEGEQKSLNDKIGEFVNTVKIGQLVFNELLNAAQEGGELTGAQWKKGFDKIASNVTAFAQSLGDVESNINDFGKAVDFALSGIKPVSIPVKLDKTKVEKNSFIEGLISEIKEDGQIIETELDDFGRKLVVTLENRAGEIYQTITTAQERTAALTLEGATTVLALNRGINEDQVADSLKANVLLAAIYKDKNDLILSQETEITNAVRKSAEAKVAAINAQILADTNQTDSTKKLTADQIAELEKLKTKFEGYKDLSFKIQPLDAKDFGLDALATDFEAQLVGLNDKLKKRRDDVVKLEQQTYEESLFQLFKKLDAGQITQEEYDKKQTEMKINHEQNLLVIEVSYGEKGQEALVDSAKKRRDYIKTEQEKEKEERFKSIEMMVDLEKQAMDVYLQWLAQQYAEEDRLSQQRFDARIALIDEEEKAYDDALANRTAAEQQAIDIKEEFDLRRDQAENERRREQNDLAEKQFQAQKYNSLAQIAIEYAVAIAKAWGTAGPFGIPMAAFLATQGGLAAAAVAMQEFVPSYATGGLVMGPGGPKDDKVKANLSNGESVINAKSTKMYAPLLSAINQAGGGVAIPNLKSGGIIMPPGANIQSVSVVNSSAVVSLDQSSIQAIGNAMSSQQITVQENTISNAQEKQAKVERRTKF
jgi:hypothetical protein